MSNRNTLLSNTSISRRTLLKRSVAGAFVISSPWMTTSARAAGELTVVLNQGLLAKLWIDGLNPKFEKETIPITGSNPNIFTVFAVIKAIFAKSSEVGLGLIAVSDKNIGPRFVIIILVVAISEIPGAFPISCIIGRATVG